MLVAEMEVEAGDEIEGEETEDGPHKGPKSRAQPIRHRVHNPATMRGKVSQSGILRLRMSIAEHAPSAPTRPTVAQTSSGTSQPLSVTNRNDEPAAAPSDRTPQLPRNLLLVAPGDA